VWGVLLLGLVLLTPGRLLSQANEPLEFGGLLRTGFRVDPDETGRSSGFEIFDARASVLGSIGIAFDYLMIVEYDTESEKFTLLDAALTVPLIPEFELSVGLFRPAFGLEALVDKGDLTFLERAQATEFIAPGRQVGVGANGSTFDGRLTYGAGVFNGNGSTLQNDGDDFMFSARAQYNSIGTIAFYDEFVVQVGGSFAYSKDTEVELGDGIATPGPLMDTSAPLTLFAGTRVLLGADVQATYRDITLTGEYYGADYDPEPGSPLPQNANAHGGYVEAGYRAYGLVEFVTRWDAFKPAVGDDRQFLLFGFNVFPGQYAKVGLQYAVGLNDSAAASTVAGNQFILLAQVDF
jgi:hypothetical protein